ASLVTTPDPDGDGGGDQKPDPKHDKPDPHPNPPVGVVHNASVPMEPMPAGDLNFFSWGARTSGQSRPSAPGHPRAVGEDNERMLLLPSLIRGFNPQPDPPGFGTSAPAETRAIGEDNDMPATALNFFSWGAWTSSHSDAFAIHDGKAESGENGVDHEADK